MRCSTDLVGEVVHLVGEVAGLDDERDRHEEARRAEPARASRPRRRAASGSWSRPGTRAGSAGRRPPALGTPSRRPRRGLEAEVEVGADERAEERGLARDEDRPSPTTPSACRSQRLDARRRSRVTSCSCGSWECQPSEREQAEDAHDRRRPVAADKSITNTSDERERSKTGHGDSCGMPTISENLASTGVTAGCSWPRSSTSTPSAEVAAVALAVGGSQFG